MMKRRLTRKKRSALRRLADALQAEIRGQRHIIPRVCRCCNAVNWAWSKTADRAAAFYFSADGCGQDGTDAGVHRNLFGLEKLIRYDMSEFNAGIAGPACWDRGRVKRLSGAAYDRTQTGTLLVRRGGEAHPRIMDVFPANAGCGREWTIATGETLD